MKKFALILVFLAISVFIYACQYPSSQQKKQERVSNDTYKKILRICPDQKKQNIVVYYFDGDCAICLAKARYIEKYSIVHPGLKPVLIAKTLNPAILHYNLDKLQIRSCIYIEKNREFENKLSFMKVTKIDPDRNTENYDKEIDNNK